MQLWKSHRVFGYEIARAQAEDKTALIILQTSPHKQEVVSALAVVPVTPEELAFEAQIRLIQAIEAVRFLGLDNDALRETFEQALQAE